MDNDLLIEATQRTWAKGVCHDYEAVALDGRQGVVACVAVVATAIAGIFATRVLAHGFVFFLQKVHSSDKASAGKFRRGDVEVRDPVTHPTVHERGMRRYFEVGKGKIWRDALDAEERLQHPSIERQLDANRRLAQKVHSMLEGKRRDAHQHADPAAEVAGVQSDEDEAELPVDVNAMREQAAASLRIPPASPDRLRPTTGALEGFRRESGICRQGFQFESGKRPLLRFSAKFDRNARSDPTDYWLAKFALLHPDEFEALVEETSLHSAARRASFSVADPFELAPMERLKADVETLKLSLEAFNSEKARMDPRPEEEVLASGLPAVEPTPVKASLHVGISAVGHFSPPISPVSLFLETEPTSALAKHALF